MTVTISCVNLKGGVGKTALAVNLAAIAGSVHKLRTLLVDLDPQTNATFWCMKPEEWEEWAISHGTLADVFGLRGHLSAENKSKGISDVIKPNVFDNVDLLPSHLDLFTMDLDLAGRTAREGLLRRAMEQHRDEYGLIVCDCPPNLTLPTQNALSISSHFLVPVSLDYLSSLGIALLLNRIDEISKDLEVELECAGVVLSRIGRPAQHRRRIESTLQEEFPKLVLDNSIKERVDVDRAAQNQSPVHAHAPGTDADREFRAVAREVLKRVGAIK